MCHCIYNGVLRYFHSSFLDINVERLLTLQTLPWIAFVLGSVFLLSKYTSQRSKIVGAYKDEENIVQALGRYEKKKYWLLVLICPVLVFLSLVISEEKAV
ncbi:hypothetical protein KRR40_14180 [Niabella defluvii]|nr:hypothetical protein KRR40_14180 [Niabella sp. I65]